MSSLTVQELRDLGNKKFRELNYGAALMRYTEAIDKDPTNYALYYNRAVTLVKMDAIDEAMEDLLKSLELNPEYIPSLCQLAFLYLYKGDTPSSLETYVKVVKANEKLPHSLNKFKAQLKQSISLAESRCLQQEYTQSFIDKIITPDVRTIIDSYPTLPNHMIESGIPPVSFGNVPVGHVQESTAIVTGASIPVPLIFGNNTQQGGQNAARGLNIGEIFSAVSRYVPPVATPTTAEQPSETNTAAGQGTTAQPATATATTTTSTPTVTETQTRPATTQTRITTIPSPAAAPVRQVIRTTVIPGTSQTITSTNAEPVQSTPRSPWDIHREALRRAAELRNQALERNRSNRAAQSATPSTTTLQPHNVDSSLSTSTSTDENGSSNVTSTTALNVHEDTDLLDSFDLD
ncbi:hypothetical protein CANINC_000496 [Pichia inconspicua]|uniref:Uncharacterized protein n=1 Tax=Pichia inconspicua TaxID=52247 RepID=A0A4T0X7Y1_9ASCO|nr:hypothetical protein CANINC_000496 [[Candida] inconspicua]